MCFYPRPVLAFGYCHCLRLCVCPCVRVCVYQSLACPHDNSSAVQARITKLGWETQNTLVKKPIILEGDRPWPSRSNLTWKSNFTSFWACPHDNFSFFSVRITKFGPEMHLSTVKKPVVVGVDWPWSSMSNLTCKSKFIPFWACPYNNLLPVHATITKFGQEMHLNTVKLPVDFGRDKPSASISFLIVKAIFLTYLLCFCIAFSAIVSWILVRQSLATDRIGLLFWSCWLNQRFAVTHR